MNQPKNQRLCQKVLKFKAKIPYYHPLIRIPINLDHGPFLELLSLIHNELKFETNNPAPSQVGQNFIVLISPALIPLLIYPNNQNVENKKSFLSPLCTNYSSILSMSPLLYPYIVVTAQKGGLV